MNATKSDLGFMPCLYNKSLVKDTRNSMEFGCAFIMLSRWFYEGKWMIWCSIFFNDRFIKFYRLVWKAIVSNGKVKWHKLRLQRSAIRLCQIRYLMSLFDMILCIREIVARRINL